MGNRQQMGLQTGEDGVSVVWVIGFLEKNPWELGKTHIQNMTKSKDDSGSSK